MKICYRYTSKLQEAEELTNESFVKLFKNLHSFDASRQLNTEALLKAWFKRIIINTCIDHLRKHHSLAGAHLHNPDNEQIADTGQTAIDKLSYEEIIEAIKELTPVYRTVFNLFAVEGMTHEEIAERLQISVGASKSNLSKARHNLRKIISQKTQYNTYVHAR